MRQITPGLVVLMWMLLIQVGAAADWPQFRGSHGAGVSSDSALPTTWNHQESIVWKTDLPGPGSSSPITFGDSIYVTCYSGYGMSANSPGEKSKLLRHLVCLRRDTGRIRWQVDLPASGNEHEYRGYIHLHGYASHTPVANDSGVYAFCGASGLVAYTHEGKRKWLADCGKKNHEWGSGTSPLLFDNLVIVAARIESGSLIAFDQRSGREAWRAEIGFGHGSPALVAVGTTYELVFVRGRQVIGADPATGKELWWCSVKTELAIPMPLAHEGTVYVMTRGQTAAIRAGGRGDVSDTHLVWEASRGSHVAMPVLYEGHLYFPHDEQGVVYCLNSRTGELVYEQRLPLSPRYLYASPVIADGKLYYVSQKNGVYVLPARPKYSLLAHNTFASDETMFNATPAISRGQLLLRSGKAIYCLGTKGRGVK